MARDGASGPAAKPFRLFVAIELSSQQLDLLARAIEPWQTEFPRLRWVPRENQHVTMKFLGSTYPRLSSWVEERIGEVASAHPPFRTSLTSLGVFPAPGRARVLWAGLDDRRGRMAEIALALEQALSAEYKPEIRAFSPHLTLARSEQPVSLPAGFASTVLEAGPFTVERLVLFRSHIQRPAPRYERLREFALGG